MQIKIGRNRRERNTYIVICVGILIGLLFFVFFHDRNTWKEDVDGNGVDETVREAHMPGGRLIRTVIHEDGTIYQTEYNPEGQIVHEWMMAPDPDNSGKYIVYVWDEKTEQWLLDQNQNGIPDKIEEPDNSDG